MLSKLVKILRPRPPEFELAGWPRHRGYDMCLPPGLEPQQTLPLVIAFHGYTQDSRKMRALSSPTGDPAHPASLDRLAQQQRFLVAYPNGTPIKLAPGRCWNAGGGTDGYAPVADPARRLGVDDVKYCRDLLADIQQRWPVDLQRIYLVGISNGGAMVCRLAAEMPQTWAAVASIAGCHQFSVSPGQLHDRPVPFLHLHGSDDPVWPFAGGPFMNAGKMLSVNESLAAWAQANGCQEASRDVLLGPTSADPTTINLIKYRAESERQEIDFYRIDGGGHAWPGGQQYMSRAVIGFVTQKFSANQAIWEFFQRHRLG